MRLSTRALMVTTIMLISQTAWAIGYRVYEQRVPRGAAPPASRSIDSGWVLVNPNDNGVCAIGGTGCNSDAVCTAGGVPHDKCVVPYGTSAPISGRLATE